VTAVVLVFVLDRAVGLQALYLHHSHPKWWQPLTATLCHASAEHLSSNLFLLYAFGREVEAEGGPAGLLASFFICGALSALSNLALLPHASAAPPVSLGASGAVFGLFSVTVLTKLTPDPRRLIEAAVLGQFVLKQLLSESRTVLTSGGSLVSGSTSHVAHLSGAAAGVLLVLGLSRILSHSDQ
jgi:membrane associated rhomboid family serine protease